MSKRPPKNQKTSVQSEKNVCLRDDEDFFPEPVVIPIEAELDLHTFSAREVEPLLDDYLTACVRKGFREVKIIHGKGTGVLKARVRSILAKHQLVLHLADADYQTGGWGATKVILKQ